MSDSDDSLLRQLGGVSSPQAQAPSSGESVEQRVTDVQSSEQLDHWRMLLVDLVYLLNGTFRDVHYWEGVKTDKDTISDFVKILHALQQMPENDGAIRIEHRGSPGTRVSEKTDYVIRFGDFTVDVASVAAVIKRIGIRVKHIEGRLIKSFEAFAAQGLDTIIIKIPDASDESLEKLRISMRIISCFKKAVEDDAPIEYVKNDQELSLKPVLNESHQPDPNLTMLAALNDLSAQNMQEMIQKVAALMRRPDFAASGQSLANVYQTIFNIKSLRQRLARPPVELNSERAPRGGKSLKGEAGGSGSSPGGGGPVAPAVKADSAALKANVARFVKEAYGDSPEKAMQVMKTIYGDDYHQLDLAGLEGRLQLITDLLTNLESSDKGQALMENVLGRIQTGMDQLPKDILDDLIVDGDEIKIWEADEEKVIGKSDDNLLKVLDTSKDRLAARKRMKTALRADGQFTEQDYEQLSKTFNISIGEAEEIAQLLKGCFDAQGNFQRALFEKNVAGYAQHPKKIFLFWRLYG